MGAKTLKLKVRNYSNFCYHIPHHIEMSRLNFQGFTEIQNGRHGPNSIFLGAQKLFFFSFLTSHSQQHVDVQVIFSRCYQNSEWPPEVGAKTLKRNVWNYKQISMTLPTIWRCAGDFFKVLLKFKMAATDQFQFSWGRKNSKTWVVNDLNFTITFPTTWSCASDFFKVLQKFKLATMHELDNCLWAHKLKN